MLISCADVPQQAAITDSYTTGFQSCTLLQRWHSNIYIVEVATAQEATKAANEALANFTGSKENIETARELLKTKIS